jgi:putative transposase
MKRSRHSDDQIAYAVKQGEVDTAVADACCQLGISEATLTRSTKICGTSV